MAPSSGTLTLWRHNCMASWRKMRRQGEAWQRLWILEFQVSLRYCSSQPVDVHPRPLSRTPNHYLNQCWPGSMIPYQTIKNWWILHMLTCWIVLKITKAVFTFWILFCIWLNPSRWNSSPDHMELIMDLWLFKDYDMIVLFLSFQSISPLSKGKPSIRKKFLNHNPIRIIRSCW